MKLLNFTIIKLCACLIVGILLSELIIIPITSLCYALIILFTCLISTFIIAKNKFKKTIWFGITTYILTLFIGVLITNFQKEKNINGHYSNFLPKNDNTYQTITFRIKDVLKSSLYNDKYVIDIFEIEKQSVTGKVLLNITKDSLKTKLEVDNIYNTSELILELQAPLNPNQFNYKVYLERQNIHHQIYSKNDNLFHVSDKIHTLNGYMNRIRTSIKKQLIFYGFKPDELAIINALILGQRQGISKEIYANYTNAGAIHILAVSGLHVGIILLILNAFLKPIEYLKSGKTLKVILIIIILWLYAILAGASASIIRAATMFSVVAIGMHLKRPSNIYNTLAISVFMILLFKPLFLFDIGFQLSYLAVIAIVSIQPLLYKLWYPKYWIIDKVWQVLTVTIAAQFGVLPISLFYFHQFPGLFWLSNIVIIPLLGFILTSGILVIILAVLNILPQFIADYFGRVISLMNRFFEWIASHEQFLVKGISFNSLYVLISYIIIIAIVRLYVSRNYKALKLVFITITGLQVISIYTKYDRNKDAFIIFHKSRKTVIIKKQNESLMAYHNLDTLNNYTFINSYKVKHNISDITEDTLKSIYFYKNKTLLSIDSLGVYNIKSIRPDYIVLRNSPKINLERLIDSIAPKQIIADGSNYKSYVLRWQETCSKRKLPFHYTGKKGAFILN